MPYPDENTIARPEGAASDDADQALAKFEEQAETSKEKGTSPWLVLGGMLLAGAAINSLSKNKPLLYTSGPVASAHALGSAIRNRRKDLRLTQKELACKAGIGTRLLSEMEQGKDTAEIGKILQVVDALDLELKIGERG